MKKSLVSFCLLLFLIVFTYSCSSKSDNDETQEVVLSSESKVLEFSFKKDDNPGLSEDLVGIVNQNLGTITFSSSVNKNVITSLKPTIIISEGATVEPNSSEFQDFSNPIEYYIFAENNFDRSKYEVIVQADNGLISDRDALIAVYNANSSNEGFKDLNWAIDIPLSSWDNIVVEDDRVIELTLDLPDDVEINLTTDIECLNKLKNLVVKPIALPSIQYISGLISLEKLSIVSNKLEILNLINLPNLKYLEIQGDSFETFSSSLGSLDNLESLVIANSNSFHGFPSSVGNLKKLESLRVSDALKLNILPSEIGQVSNLKKLWFSNCRLRILPSEIGQLVNLEEFEVIIGDDDEPLQGLPATVSNLSKLKRLSIRGDGVGLDEFPLAILELKSLTYLRLSGGERLNSIPDGIDNLVNLEELILRNNDMKTIPEEIGNLISLKKLDVSSSALEELPESLANLTNLLELDISGNRYLKELPLEIGSLSNLVDLQADWCSLITIPSTIGNLSNLEALDLRNNPLESLPSSICSLVTQGTNIELSSNKEHLLNICQ